MTDLILRAADNIECHNTDEVMRRNKYKETIVQINRGKPRLILIIRAISYKSYYKR